MYLDFCVFAKLHEEAKLYSDLDMYIAERGWQFWMEQYSDEEIADILKTVYQFSKMNITELRNILGISRAEMQRKFLIPKRSLENWEAEVNTPPEYLVRFLAYSIFLKIMNKEEQSDDIGE